MAKSRKHLRANCRVLGDGSMLQDHSHVSRKTTLDIYGHVLQEDFAEPLAEMAGKLGNEVKLRVAVRHLC